LSRLADGRERCEWQRAAVVAAALTGAPPEAFMPERYRVAEEPVPVSEGESRRGWAILTAGWLGGAPGD
jgi:hypothetical protein